MLKPCLNLFSVPPCEPFDSQLPFSGRSLVRDDLVVEDAARRRGREDETPVAHFRRHGGEPRANLPHLH